jgi:CspA family cold shock protein
MARGTVKWFNDRKGYGFIIPNERQELDVFVHYSQIRCRGFRTLEGGERVEFEMFQDPKGTRARDVIRLEGH